jgi:hypothetical protein
MLAVTCLYICSDSDEDWHDVYTENAKPPSALTVTHVNHTHDLQVIFEILINNQS